MSGIVGSAGSKSGIIGTTELDYEEGTFAINWSSLTLSSGSATIDISLGNYTKIGNTVRFTAFTSISGAYTAAGTGGTVYFTLPFTTEQYSTCQMSEPIEGWTYLNGSIKLNRAYPTTFSGTPNPLITGVYQTSE